MSYFAEELAMELRLEEEALIAHTRINKNGRIVIPAAMRERMGLKAEDAVVLTLEGGVLRVVEYHENLRRIQEELAQLVPPGRLISEELIADRRFEALLEQETFERARELRRVRVGYGSEAFGALPVDSATKGGESAWIGEPEEAKIA